MAQCDREIPQLGQVEGGAAAEHRQAGDIQFGTLHILPTLLSTPNAHAIFWLLQLLPRKTRGLLGSSSEPEADVSEEGGGVEAEDQWWKNSLGPRKGVKPTKRQSLGSLKAECDKLAQAWLARGKDATQRQVDHTLTDMLQWWKDHEVGNVEIADLARRRLCAQALSATLERAFSKAGLIMSKKRQRLTADHVDGISLMGWHYKDHGWGELAKGPRCGAEMKTDRR